ncbi:hypothetical protein MKW94_003272 [Papaver nudicaule]|uniref:Leucine-rich repeat-containing N-terminal plant-type domain-containing protein n=1 Tax=Papaver nudicaule TaxID=74823 RepID=A0AA41V4T4_PAPNU|nr:hypothetical protein [Papaver nudicaule]
MALLITTRNSISLIFFICFSLLLPHQTKSCHVTDHEALLDFKQKITYDPYNLLQTWMPLTNCCTSWEGVACNSKGRVINISRPGLYSTSDFISDTSISNLFYKGLTSYKIGENRTKRIFSPSNNLLSGVIPYPVFQSLTSLAELSLSTNQLSGGIPFLYRQVASIKGLKNLKYLDLSENHLTGSLPSSIGELTELSVLYLNQNHLSGSFPCSISNLVSLRFCEYPKTNLPVICQYPLASCRI